MVEKIRSSSRINLEKIYVSFIAIIFYFFFMSPALSLSINRQAVYIHWFVPFFDFKFDTYLINTFFKNIKFKYFFAIFLTICFCVLTNQIYLLIKIMIIIFCLVYLAYSQKTGTFEYLYLGMNINIIVAILQFVLYYIDKSLAYMLGPTNISNMLFGEYAAQTNTNMYSIWGNSLIRVSGWSREAGFFVALLNICFIIYHYRETRKSKLQYVLFIIAYIISFSKMSFLLPLMFLTAMLSKYINKIPFLFTFIFVHGVLTLVSYFMMSNGFFTSEHESIMHRMIGYYMIFILPLKQFLIGFNDISYLDIDMFTQIKGLSYLKIRGYYDLCGLPYIVQTMGIIGLLIFVYLLNYIGVTSSGLILFLLSTFDVDPFTVSSFIVLAYWAIMNLDVFKPTKLSRLFNEA